MLGALFGFAIFCGIAIVFQCCLYCGLNGVTPAVSRAGGFKEDHAVAFGVAFFVVIPFLCFVVDGLLR